MTKKTKSGKMSFRLNFEWFTNYVRDLWAEGEYVLAVTLLTDCDIPIGEAHDVIRGKRKMIQDPDGAPGADGLVVQDSWTPDLSRSFLDKYPDPLDMAYFRMVNKYGVKGLSDMKRVIEAAARSMNEATNYFDKLHIVREVKDIPNEVYKFFDIPRPETLSTGDYGSTALYNIGLNRAGQDVDSIRLKAQITAEIRAQAADDLRDDKIDMHQIDPVRKAAIAPGLPSVEDYIKHQLELDKRPKPEPDPHLDTPTGYILPDGKFYACAWMEHSWLAFVLGVNNTENANKAGWIMITHPIDEPRKYYIYEGDKEPTQTQLDTLDSWRQRYGACLVHDGVKLDAIETGYKPAFVETSPGEFTPNYGDD